MTTLVRTEAPIPSILTIWHGEDWTEAFPQILNPLTGSALDVSAFTFELFCRPSFDHATRFLLATNGAGITIEDGANGLISFFKEQAAIEAALPISNAFGWAQFLRMTFTDALFGAVTKIHSYGPLIVMPARDAPTA